MSAFKMTRRASCGVFGAVVLAWATERHALAVTRAAGGIHVDVAPLRENSGDPTAAWVARVMPGARGSGSARRRGFRQDRLRHPGAELRRGRTSRLVPGPDDRGGGRGRRRPAAARRNLVLPVGGGRGNDRSIELRPSLSTLARVRLLGRAGVLRDIVGVGQLTQPVG